MPVERKYHSNAARQAAYRARHPEKRQPTEVELAILARNLHAVFDLAVEADQSPLPHHLLGDRVDRTLQNLIRYLDPCPPRFPPVEPVEPIENQRDREQ